MTSGIAQRVERVELLRQPAPLGRVRSEAVLRAGLCDIEATRSWLSAVEATVVAELQAVTPMPEAECSTIDRTLAAVFAEATPESCPAGPIEKQKHLRALALERLMTGDANVVRMGQPEFVAAISVGRCARSIAGAQFRAVRRTSIAARSTTSSGGAMAGSPISAIWCRCACITITRSTTPAGSSRSMNSDD